MIQNIGIVGSGQMGAGIAHVAANGGPSVDAVSTRGPTKTGPELATANSKKSRDAKGA